MFFFLNYDFIPPSGGKWRCDRRVLGIIVSVRFNDTAAKQHLYVVMTWLTYRSNDNTFKSRFFQAQLFADIVVYTAACIRVYIYVTGAGTYR